VALDYEFSHSGKADFPVVVHQSPAVGPGAHALWPLSLYPRDLSRPHACSRLLCRYLDRNSILPKDDSHRSQCQKEQDPRRVHNQKVLIQINGVRRAEMLRLTILLFPLGRLWGKRLLAAPSLEGHPSPPCTGNPHVGNVFQPTNESF